MRAGAIGSTAVVITWSRCVAIALSWARLNPRSMPSTGSARPPSSPWPATRRVVVRKPNSSRSWPLPRTPTAISVTHGLRAGWPKPSPNIWCLAIFAASRHCRRPRRAKSIDKRCLVSPVRLRQNRRSTDAGRDRGLAQILWFAAAHREQRDPGCRLPARQTRRAGFDRIDAGRGLRREDLRRGHRRYRDRSREPWIADRHRRARRAQAPTAGALIRKVRENRPCGAPAAVGLPFAVDEHDILEVGSDFSEHHERLVGVE